MAITQQKRNCVFCCWVYYRSNTDMKKKKYIRKSPINKIKSESPMEHGVRYKMKKMEDKIRKIKLGNK